MNTIQFKKITYRNILSVGAMPIVLDLQRSSTTAILGSNGHGKSVFLEALAFVLYGKPYRDITKAKLINNKNNKGLLVEIEFSNNDNEVTIKRGIKPDVFEIHINGELVDQSANSRDYQAWLESNLLKMDFDTFKQLVLIGKVSYVPFMRLTTPKRRAFIESVLSLDVFADMTTLHNANAKENAQKLQDADRAINTVTVQLSSTRDSIARIKTEAERMASIANEQHTSNLTALNAKLEAQTKLIDELKAKLQEFDIDMHVKAKELMERDIRKYLDEGVRYRSRIEAYQSDMSFYKDNNKCPTCKQDISADLKQQKQHECESEIASLEIMKSDSDGLAADLSERVQEHETALGNARKIMQAIVDIQKMNDATIAEIEAIKQKMKSQESANLYKADTSDLEDKADLLEVELRGNKEVYNQLAREKDYDTMISQLLKDTGIKAIIIDKFLPLINAKINDYLHKLGLFASFELDNQFNETIKMRGFEPMLYNQLSEGEKLRFDMAVMLAWRDIAKLKSNMSCNLLILDETFDSSLDQNGVDAFADLLKLLGELNVFVITHTPEKLAETFRSFIRFERKDGFTILSPNSGF